MKKKFAAVLALALIIEAIVIRVYTLDETVAEDYMPDDISVGGIAYNITGDYKDGNGAADTTNYNNVIGFIKAALMSKQTSVSCRLSDAQKTAWLQPDCGALLSKAIAKDLGASDQNYLDGEYLFSNFKLGNSLYSETYEITYNDLSYMSSGRLTNQIEYLMDANQEQQVIAKAKSIAASLSGNKYQKLTQIEDWICSHTAYGNGDVSNGYAGNEGTAYGVMFDGRAVCSGYAQAFYLICRQAGIPCHIITGTAGTGTSSQRHAWNIVKLGNSWYNVDCTWDDGARPSKTFFLKSNADFSNSNYCYHIPDPDIIGLSNYPIAAASYVNDGTDPEAEAQRVQNIINNTPADNTQPVNEPAQPEANNNQVQPENQNQQNQDQQQTQQPESQPENGQEVQPAPVDNTVSPEVAAINEGINGLSKDDVNLAEKIQELNTKIADLKVSKEEKDAIGLTLSEKINVIVKERAEDKAKAEEEAKTQGIKEEKDETGNQAVHYNFSYKEILDMAMSGGVARIKPDQGLMLSKEFFKEALGEYNLYIESFDGNASFEFGKYTMNVSNISTGGFTPEVKLSNVGDTMQESVEKANIGDKNLIKASFSYDGNLPGEAEVTLDLSSFNIPEGTEVVMYYYNPSTDSLEKMATATTANHHVVVTMTHCSDYVLATEKPVDKTTEKKDDGQDEKGIKSAQAEKSKNVASGKVQITKTLNVSESTDKNMLAASSPKTGVKKVNYYPLLITAELLTVLSFTFLYFVIKWVNKRKRVKPRYW